MLFAYIQHKNSALIFPLATCSLDAYFTNTDPTKCDKGWQARHTAWLFEQFSGLAHGLAKVHVNKESDLSPDGPATGYHHDIKPSNILLFDTFEDGNHPFEGAEIEFGRLQLSDFGLGKFRTKLEGTGTQNIRGTVTYRAPECDPDHDPKKGPKKQNRKYDIWCIGCVLLELLVWIFEGPDGHKGFKDLRLVE